MYCNNTLDEPVWCPIKDGKHNFLHTSKYLSDDDLIYKKEIFLYNHMTSPDKFHETSLPPIEPLTGENYERAHQIWSRFGIQKHATISRPPSFRRVITDWCFRAFQAFRLPSAQARQPAFYNISFFGVGTCSIPYESRIIAHYRPRHSSAIGGEFEKGNCDYFQTIRMWKGSILTYPLRT